MEKGELLKIKFAKVRKKLTAIPKASVRGTLWSSVVLCRRLCVFCKKKLKKDWESNQRQNKKKRQNQHIT